MFRISFFWEIALEDTLAWATEFIQHSGVNVLKTTYVDMIDSTKLPDFHKDPFDRILISQAKAKSLIIVTKDKIVPNYEVEIFWI